MNSGLKKVTQENLTSKVYDQIKNALMRGQFRPGDRMAIRPLAEQLGTSPTPVREALLKLISFGALEMKPAHPIVVPTMTRDKYLENRTLRLSIEGLAAETAAANMKKKDIDREIYAVMATFKPRKGSAIRTSELWQKVGLNLEKQHTLSIGVEHLER